MPILDSDYKSEPIRVREEQRNTVDSLSYIQKKDFSKEDTHIIVSKYLSGISIAKLSRIYNCAESVIKRILLENEITMSSEKRRERQVRAAEKKYGYTEKEIVDLYTSGLTMVDITRMKGISDKAIRRILNKYNIERYPQSFWLKKGQ